MKYTFKFKLFGGNVKMFSEGNMGIVVEKEAHVVCVYGTDGEHNDILCAIPLCTPKLLKGAEYTIEFFENDCAKIAVADIQLAINFGSKKCASNKALQCYGSEAWGQDVQAEWGSI